MSPPKGIIVVQSDMLAKMKIYIKHKYNFYRVY